MDTDNNDILNASISPSEPDTAENTDQSSNPSPLTETSETNTQSLDSQKPAVIDATKQGTKKINRKMIIVIAASIAVLAVIAGAVVFFLMTRKDDYIPSIESQCNFLNHGEFTYDDNNYYFIGEFSDSDKTKCLYAMSRASGNKKKLAINKDLDDMRLCDGKIVYRTYNDDEYTIGCIDVDGNNDYTILRVPNSSDVYLYNYDAHNGYLYYVYEHKLHKCNMDGSEDTVLINTATNFILTGEYIYYTTDDAIYSYKLRNGEIKQICSMQNESISLYNDKIYYKNDTGLYCISIDGNESPTKLIRNDLQIPLKQHAVSDRTACCSASSGTE